MVTQAKNSMTKIFGLIVLVVFCLGVSNIAYSAIRFEHVAINVENPKQVADWYVKYVGLEILSASKKMIFVRDPGGNFMFEFYHKPDAVGSFASLNHSAGHVAFASDDADALSKKMQQGGAKIVDTTTNPVGDTVINMTDPWGNALQVIHRVKPKLK